MLILYIQRKNHSFERNIEALKERSVIEELEVLDPILILILDQYVKGEINSEDFFMVLKQIK